MGDFNELHVHEKVGGWRRTEHQMQGFRDALSYGDLFDIGYLGMCFTWKGSETKCRLDRAVASATWTDLFSVARVTHLPPSRSDHIPLLLGVYASNPPVCSFHHRFRFESFWIQDDGCGSVVQRGWGQDVHGPPMFQVIKKISNCRMELDHWQRITFRERSKKIENTRLQL